MLTEYDRLDDAVEGMFSASVTPYRSVDRIRRAVVDGRDVEPYLRDMEEGLEQIHALYYEVSPRPQVCQGCKGTGRAAPPNKHGNSEEDR